MRVVCLISSIGLIALAGCASAEINLSGEPAAPDRGTHYDPAKAGPDAQSAPVKPADGGAPSSGGASCTDIFWCFSTSKCAASDAPCIDGCVHKGSAPAQAAYAAASSCESKALSSGGACAAQCQDPASESCPACLDGACAQPYAACGFVLHCAQLKDCLGKCGQDDLACGDRCQSQLTLVGSLRYAAVIACELSSLLGSCKSPCADSSSAGCSSCIATGCAAQYQACASP